LAQIDLYFHDLDVVAKETLLGLRALLDHLSEGALSEITPEIQALLAPSIHRTVARTSYQ
jgi:hypothetical protein